MPTQVRVAIVPAAVLLGVMLLPEAADAHGVSRRDATFVQSIDVLKRATILYSWKSTGFVDFDFHTEPAGKPPEASDSFEKGEAVQKKGGYTAPYDGIHGWYWENPTDREVTVTLKTAGIYTDARVFLPEQQPQTIRIPERP